MADARSGSPTIALIGLGAIGQALVAYLHAAEAPVHVLGALVADPQRVRACPVFGDVDELLESGADLVVECARQHVLQSLGPKVLESGKSLIAASVGALAAERAYEFLTQAACAGGAQIIIPAGALAGIDALAAARHAGVSNVRYTRCAPPSTWAKSGAITEIQAAVVKGTQVVFEGDAREAATRYPKNANVTATVALAGIGFERTRVTLIADAAAQSNVHIIEAEGAFGTLRTEVSARPLPGGTSSAIVAGSLARAVLSRSERIAI
jgi:aspartate dehydrogenase